MTRGEVIVVTGDAQGRPPTPGGSQSASSDPTGSQRARGGVLVAVLPALPVLIAAAVAAAAVAVLTLHPATSGLSAGGRHQVASARPGLAAMRAATQNRKLAAAWITAQVSRGVVVGCDPQMCQALVDDGFPAGDLQQYGTGAADALGAGVIVSTTAVRAALGPRLVSVYAPAVLASFGSGQEMVAVLAAAPEGAAAYLSAARADQLARQQAGAQLLRNPNVQASASAHAELADGKVDSRLLITVAGLAHMVPVRIREFAGAGPGADAPLRSMTISGAAPSASASGDSYPDTVLAFLHAQQAPLPTEATISGAGAATVLRISVTAPSPLGLLPAQPSSGP